MTKSKGVGRGGARRGAGRKPKVAQVPSPVRAAAVEEPTGAQSDITAKAKAGALRSIKRLNSIVANGSAVEAIKAASLLLTWGFVTPANAAAVAAADSYKPSAEPKPDEPAAPLTKREARQQNAEQSSSEGTYAVPTPPRLAVDNTR